MKCSQQEKDIGSKRLAKGKTCSTRVGYLAMWLKYSKKECLYHIINYTHDNAVLNKSLGKL